MEGADPLGEALLDGHATGVLLDQELGSGGEVVGDQDGRVFVPEPADSELADVAVVVREANVVVVDDLGRRQRGPSRPSPWGTTPVAVGHHLIRRQAGEGGGSRQVRP